MSLQIESDPTPLSIDARGTVCVGGTGVPLENILWLYNQGFDAQAVSQSYPGVELADIHAVIAFYLRHKARVDEYLQERAAQAEALRSQREVPAGPTKATLQERWATRQKAPPCSGS